MRCRALLLFVALGVALGAPACTEAGLEEIPPPKIFKDDKLKVSGSICTKEPESKVFPLRVLFIVDASESMEITDPPDPVSGITGRERAVRETWEELVAQGGEDVRIGIIRFSAQAQGKTPVDLDGDALADTYYAPGTEQGVALLDAATVSLSETDRTTNYVNALSEAYFEMRTELLRAELESLPLSKYVVVFISDGLPDVDDEETDNSNGIILEAVEALAELGKLFRVGDFQFHTAYISAGNGPVFDQPAQELLQQMAETGGGTYRSFPNGEELNFLFVDFSIIKRVFTLQTLAAVNLNMLMDSRQVQSIHVDSGEVPTGFLDLDGDRKLSCGEPLLDTDGDGLGDIIEGLIGTDPMLRDTDDDGLSDRLEWDLESSELDPLDPADAGCFIANPCADENNDGACDCLLDSNGDGVCDCVANGDCVLGDRDCVDVKGPVTPVPDGWCDCPDLDGDGFCDYEDRDGDSLNNCEELYFGTAQNGNDTDADGVPDLMEIRYRTSAVEADSNGDLDWDQAINATEVLAGTDPLCEDATYRSRVAYRYELNELGLVGAKTCYEFDISNIVLASTMDNPDPEVEYPGNGWNRVLVFAGEVAFDDPDAFAAYRVACVMVNYRIGGDFKNPPSGKMFLEEADFVDVVDFDPDTHCKRP